ncbi:SAM-dependent methyltransferase [Paracoccus pacificus]|uniref:SAM-dependent methyltransferase n=1 Tax=Paracoccus pacificus TaxID=1463598 RepID=A0ABW4RAN2_9RHOB
MNTAPATPHASRLTDRKALSRQRDRARRQGTVDYLQRLAAVEVQDRLAEVNRRFTRVAVITAFPEIWREYFPDARFVADETVLDLPQQSLDLVVHAMGLHWSDDPVGQIIQSRLALVPDGLFIAVLPGGRSLAGLRAALTRAEAEVSGGLSPRLLPMADIRDLGALINRAGLALGVADQLEQRVSWRDAFHMMRDLRGMGEANAMQNRLRVPTRRAVLTRAAEIMAETCADPDNPGRIRDGFELIFLTGWAPAEGQQKPLRPGSARMSLAEALNSQEKPRP